MHASQYTWKERIRRLRRSSRGALENLFDNLDEPSGRSAAALGHDEPLMEARESANRRERNGILVRGNRMERKNQVERGKHPSLAQRVQDLVHARDGQLAEAVELVDFTVVDGDPPPPDFFEMTTGDLEFGEVECRIRLAVGYWFMVASTSLAKMGFIRWDRAVTAALPSENEISKGIRE